MKFLGIDIKNVLSFSDAHFSFQDYNVIVGTNNSGKTNLLRILEMVSKNRFSDFNLPHRYKYNKDESSRIILEISVTNKEFKLIFSTWESNYPTSPK